MHPMGVTSLPGVYSTLDPPIEFLRSIGGGCIVKTTIDDILGDETVCLVAMDRICFRIECRVVEM